MQSYTRETICITFFNTCFFYFAILSWVHSIYITNPFVADQFLKLKFEDMEYTRTMLSSHSHEQYWSYWIHKVDFTNPQHSYYPGSVVMSYISSNTTTNHQYQDHQDPLEQMLFVWNSDLPLLFMKHEQILYCCLIVLSSVGILYGYGVRLWDKY